MHLTQHTVIQAKRVKGSQCMAQIFHARAQGARGGGDVLGHTLQVEAADITRSGPVDESMVARVRPTKWLKGSQLLWSNFTHVRDIEFTPFRPVSYPVMTQGLS